MSQPADDNSPAFGWARSIRAANPSDLPAILDLEQATPLAAHWSPEHYQRRIQSQPQAACFLVAESHGEEDGQVCGFVCARIVADEWEIENIVVRQEFRREGIGSQLMQALIRNWKDAGGRALLLEVRATNTAARTFYERQRLREVGRRSAYYRDPTDDAILYTLKRDEYLNSKW